MKKRTMLSSLQTGLKRRWISPMRALVDHGCMSLSQRCGELRRAGVKVQSRWAESNGKRFKEYRVTA